MTALEALSLGLLQGLSEFIPVSSSGHLVLAEEVLHIGADNFTFDTMLNIGTLLALGFYFHREFLDLASGLWRAGEQRRLLVLIVVATLPGVIVGVLFQDMIETQLRSGYVVVVMLVLVALAMLVVERYRPSTEHKNTTWMDSIAIGLAQVMAFIPGTSRSGATIIAGMARGLSRPAAATFSFFLAVPILGGGVLKVLFEDGVIERVREDYHLYLIGILASFASGYLAVSFLLRFLKNHSLHIFAYYRIALAAIILIALTTTN